MVKMFFISHGGITGSAIESQTRKRVKFGVLSHLGLWVIVPIVQRSTPPRTVARLPTHMRGRALLANLEAFTASRLFQLLGL